MWPWTHLAFGYLVYSAYSHHRWATAPTSAAVIVVGLATQLPDAIDKPLGWWLGVLPGGRSLAHSLLTAALLVGLAVAVGRYLRVERVWVAFAVGYLSHLAGDVLYPLVVKGELRVGFLLWPLTATGTQPVAAPTGKLAELVLAFATFLATPVGVLYLVADLSVVGGALVLWWWDGAPGLAWIRRTLRGRPDRSP